MSNSTTVTDPLLRAYLERERQAAVARLRQLDCLLGRPPTLPERDARRDVARFERRRLEGERGE